jgi:O-antigen/teichoic acid export membrane protein
MPLSDPTSPPAPGASSGNPPPSAPAAKSKSTFVPYLLLLFSDFACRGLRFLADIVLVRHFSREMIGQLNLGQSLAIQGIGLSTCGLDTAGTRAIAAGSVPPKQMAATVVVLRLILGMITWGAVVGLALLIPKYQAVFQFTVLYGLSIMTGALTIGWVPQAQNRMHVVALAMLATNVLYFGGVELTTHVGWPPSAVPLILAVSEGLTALALWIWLILRYGPLSRGMARPEALRFLRDSLPIGGAAYVRLLINSSDVLLLGLFVSDGDLGMYSTAFKLYALGTSVIIIYLGVLLPQLAAHAARDSAAVTPALQTSLRRTLLAATVVTPAAMFFATTALRLLFGAPFVAAGPALQILFLAWPALIASGHFRIALVAHGRQRQDLRLIAAAAFAHAISKICLIPWLGINGAACGTLASEVFLMIIAGQAWNLQEQSAERQPI